VNRIQNILDGLNQLQAVTVCPISRQQFSSTNKSQRGTSGAGWGPKYAKINPPSSATE